MAELWFWNTNSLTGSKNAAVKRDWIWSYEVRLHTGPGKYRSGVGVRPLVEFRCCCMTEAAACELRNDVECGSQGQSDLYKGRVANGRGEAVCVNDLDGTR